MKPPILFFTFLTSLFCSFAQDNSLKEAGEIIGIDYTEEEIELMTNGVEEQLKNYQSIRSMNLANDVPFSMMFTFPMNESRIPGEQQPIEWNIDKGIKKPKNLNELAFYSISELAALIQKRKISSLELTQLFLDRLDKYSDTLECVITITDSMALAQAKRADNEIADGNYKGLLHGIPYGVKDLLAVEGYKTTFGAKPYENQVLKETATVVKKLEEAGAVLVAKLTLGALAWGDVWYGGKTRNPWNLEEGSSGSSAGPSSATAAGLVPFAIGSETWGSIVSPSTRCGNTGLRPTYGRVSKSGAMTLSWSMDKLGPICKYAEDCAIVLESIRGEDGMDLQVQNRPFNYQYPLDFTNLKVGYLTDEFADQESNNFKNDSTTLALLKEKGIELIPKSLPNKFEPSIISFILSAEAAAAFDELTISAKDDMMVRQIENAWPNVFRQARLIPAVEYIQANRLRYQLVIDFNKMMEDIDVLVAPSFVGHQLLMTNLTGHPCVVLPNGSYADGNPGSIVLLGNHFDEANILAFAKYLQEMTPYEEEHPSMFLE
ncbi:MAG: amidase [Cyclobacteriaceae bacterium]